MHTIQKYRRLALLCALAACSNTADGMRQDTDRAADKTTKAATATGDAMGGAMETASVKTAIMADSRVDAGDINVDTDEARKTVTLNGAVKTKDQKRIAGEIAAEKAKGYSVVNNLAIRP
jgi:osmotically-inducible protein OsmY